MSTFSGINTAYTGLVAARLGLDITGQNIANAKTDGYTRQRVATSAMGPVSNTGLLDGGFRPGQGVFVSGIARLGNATLDAQVRGTAAHAGFWQVRAQAYANIEATLREPGENGISSTLGDFWAAWQDLGNRAGESSSGAALLQQANTLTIQIARGYTELDSQWSTLRGNVDSLTGELNGLAGQVAQLNDAIRKALQSGGSANELVDQRNVLTERLAALAGGVVRDRGDGMVDVTIGGNAIVAGASSREVAAVGVSRMRDLDLPGAREVHLEWTTDGLPNGETIALDGGTLAGALSVLAPANGGAGGSIAEAAKSYDELAKTLADAVNDVHALGSTPGNPTTAPADGGPFFAYDPDNIALSLKVVPRDVSEIAAALPGAGGKNGGNADQIAEIAKSATGPDSLWSSFVTRTGVASRGERQQSDLADLASNAAVGRQLSEASVDLDEENLNLLMYQHAYQGAARVMTAMDEMLDTLINRMGLVGR